MTTRQVGKALTFIGTILGILFFFVGLRENMSAIILVFPVIFLIMGIPLWIAGKRTEKAEGQEAR